jgi:hypothetical protein
MTGETTKRWAVVTSTRIIVDRLAVP